MAAADSVRKDFVGDEIYLRGLIEFSNYCKNNCLYCGLRRDNKNIKRYRMDISSIINTAKHVSDLGLKTVVLQSGEDLWFSKDKMSEIISQIKSLGLAVTLSIGEKDFSEYAAYKNAGADRFLIRIETTDKNLYAQNDPEMSWNKRCQCLHDLKKLNYELGSGCLVGLPGQTLESLADDILFFYEIGCDMVGIGPFIPHPDTPLGQEKSGQLDLALRVMALTRLMLPDINIPATTAMETLHPDGLILALQGGANVIMPNFTPQIYRLNYQLYPGKNITDTADDNLRYLKNKINQIGRKIGSGTGTSLKWQKEQRKKNKND